MKTKTKWKKLLSLLLICMMLVSLLPTVAFAQNLNTHSQSGTGWAYDKDTNTLTLNNYSGSDGFTLDDRDKNYVIEVKGTNTVPYITSQGTLMITGDGTLNIGGVYSGSSVIRPIRADHLR